MDAFTQQSQAFIAWLSSCPGAAIHPDISVADFRARGAGRGVVALQDIPADTDLFTIPRSSVISTATSDLPSRLPEVFGDLDDPWLGLILVLLYEHARGQQSPWSAYFDILPSTFDTLMYWSDAELDELQASDVRSKIGKTSADALFNSTVIPIIRKNPDVFDMPSSTHTPNQILQLAHRMGSTIMAYAFDLEKDPDAHHVDEDGYETEDEEYAALPKGMVPLADMLNADAEFNAHLFQGATSLTMKSLRPISKGEEILNDYGPLPRSDLLRRYGYVTPKYTRYDVVELPQKDLVHLCQNVTNSTVEELAAKVHAATHGEVDLTEEEETFLLERESEDTNDMGTNPSTPTLKLPDEAVTLTQLLLASEDEGRHLKKLEPARKAELNLQVGRVLEQLLTNKSAAYATSTAEDRAYLQDSTVQGRRRMAIEVRLGEKVLLQEAIDLARQMQQPTNGHAADEPASKKRRTD
ncbi:hypothetical protein FH972_024855 [Carpinus fangiana]|uniref:N-lysine methyltransferase n=1 Tax=Carpinus fangiana TaxID=176857 RepID=A0A5N6KZX4_9ROSI|nr:hypothetical protein FH972_024855 [Carpinus fangiana]